MWSKSGPAAFKEAAMPTDYLRGTIVPKRCLKKANPPKGGVAKQRA